MAGSMRLSGAVVNYNVLIVIAKGIITANDCTLLAENGGMIKLGWKWQPTEFTVAIGKCCGKCHGF